MESRPGGTNLVEPRRQGAALPSVGAAMQPWWTTSGAGIGAVSPAVVAPGSGAGISLSSSPVGGSGGAGAAKGAASDESSEDSRRSGEPKGMRCFISVEAELLIAGSCCSGFTSLQFSVLVFLAYSTSSGLISLIDLSMFTIAQRPT
jgi:hypothetical protein